MYRRVVSLLLLPCLLLTQSVALGHCHREGKPTGHDYRPHFHTNAVPVRDTHDHGHHHYVSDGHHHQHDDDGVPPGEPVTLPTHQPETVPDHDSDAIYVTVVDAVAVERSESTEGVASSVWWTVTHADLFACSWDDPPAHSQSCSHPPPLTGQICPLYVRHRALLI